MIVTPANPARSAAPSAAGASVLVVGARDGDLAWLRACASGLDGVAVAGAASLDEVEARADAGGVWAVCADVDVEPPAPAGRAGLRPPWVVLADEARRGDALRRVRDGAWDLLLRAPPGDETRAALRRAIAFGARQAAEAARARRAGEHLAADVEAVLDALAASVAHGINTPLAGALAGVGIARHVARTLLNALAGDAEVDRGALAEALGAVLEACDDARRGVDGAALVTRGVALLGGGDGGAQAACDLERALDAARAVAGTVVRHRAELRVRLDPLPPVAAAEARLARLCLMMLLGAARAIPEGGPGGHAVTVVASARAGRVTLAVEDTGASRAGPAAGDDRWVRACRALAAALGGELSALPAARGTRVTLSLPAAARPSNRPPPLHAAPAGAAGRRGRVLLVDDEPVLLALMRRILQRDHDVVATTRPAEAVALLAGGERFDVILCDLMMPDLSGVEVHRRVSRDAPEMAGRMVFITAGAFSEPAHAFLRDGGVDWVEKPIDPDDLRALVAARVARG
ncbi:MAG: response regulator [Polyangiales bacterium]